MVDRFDAEEVQASRDILGAFVEQYERDPSVSSYEELEAWVTSEIGQALGVVILGEGTPNTNPKSPALANLTVQRPHERIEGAVSTLSSDPASWRIHITERRRNLLPWYHRARQVAFMSDDPVGHGSMAEDVLGTYFPLSVSPRNIEFWGRTVGSAAMHREPGSPRTGTQYAEQAVGDSDRYLEGFLRVTARLTGKLLQ